MAKTWQSINQNDISDIESFYSHVAKVHDDFLKTQKDIKIVELEIQKIADQIKNINTYKKYKSIYTGYEKSTDKDAYLRMHESKIILFEAARGSLGTVISKQSLDSISALKNRIQELTVESNKLMAALYEQKRKLSEVNQLRSNLESYLKSPNQMPHSQKDKTSL